MSDIACDVSYYQAPVNDSYPHRWLIFRLCDGSFEDPNVGKNLAWCVRNLGGKLDGYTVYVVYRPGLTSTILHLLDKHHIPTDCHVMIDVESWDGQVKGNHSKQITKLANAIAKRQGSRSRVWCYGNRNDLNHLYPNRPKWLSLVVASYGGSKPANPGPGPMVGWQYTNGEYKVAGLPHSSAPFGACDHNQLYLSASPQSRNVRSLDMTDLPHDVWAYDQDGKHAQAWAYLRRNPWALRLKRGKRNWQAGSWLTMTYERVMQLITEVGELRAAVEDLHGKVGGQVEIPPQDVTIHIQGSGK